MSFIDDTRKNMQEKVSWAERSHVRMRHARDNMNPVEVQDHFWSFLHAARLIWHYFARWAAQNRRSNRSATARVQQWEQTLTPAERVTWSLVGSLRNSDVHVEPVAAGLHRRVAVRDHKVVVSEGKVVVVESYVVRQDGRDIDPFQLCENAMPLLRRFVGDLDRL